ncbi:kelch-like protein 24 isoform X2 [Branchiostoma floridae]|uniref:Kelch-like protein 24 isoform X2 n=1 Tax=Branchiostoma floridae TaxID=7739 RepID=A0A9J7LCP8_BRAFL|nr:kelch-like protein 24 isoform X2 [Branchiostoma floridae]
MDGHSRVTGDRHTARFYKRLQELRSEGHLVDVTLCAEGKELPCHRFVLSICTDYYRAMFSGSHSESKKDKVEIGGVNGEALEMLVDYAYTSKLHITMDNVQPLFEAANMLQVEPVECQCEEFLKEHLCAETCLGTWALADKVLRRHLSGLARSFALKNFEGVCRTEEFLQLPVDFLVTYISDNGLHAKKEEHVMEAVMSWVKHNLDERQEHLKLLMESVRFTCMDQDYLQNLMQTDKVFAGIPDIEFLIEDESIPRQIFKEEILVFGGKRECYGNETNPYMYRLDLQCDCIANSPLPQSLQKTAGSAVCVVQNDVIVTGGIMFESKVWRYQTSQNSWGRMAFLKTGRYRHGMAALDGRVYVVGGKTNASNGVRKAKILSSVEMYSSNNWGWKKQADLKLAVCNFGIATCCEKVYVFGGFTGLKKKTDAVQFYDPSQNVWTFAAPLPRRIQGISACTVGFRIYLVGGRLDCVLCYNPQEDCYVKLANNQAPWDHSSATVCGSEIYITGGHSTRLMLCHARVQCYDVSSDTMILGHVENLPVPLRDHHTVTIPKYKAPPIPTVPPVMYEQDMELHWTDTGANVEI